MSHMLTLHTRIRPRLTFTPSQPNPSGSGLVVLHYPCQGLCTGIGPHVPGSGPIILCLPHIPESGPMPSRHIRNRPDTALHAQSSAQGHAIWPEGLSMSLKIWQQKSSYCSPSAKFLDPWGELWAGGYSSRGWVRPVGWELHTAGIS